MLKVIIIASFRVIGIITKQLLQNGRFTYLIYEIKIYKFKLISTNIKLKLFLIIF